ncbi:MAG: hypothetical protein IJD85_07450, partial [Oscillospiraceae bacterium]|nr:hypothetical protein [Oscillospiraceae bacterium]
PWFLAYENFSWYLGLRAINFHMLRHLRLDVQKARQRLGSLPMKISLGISGLARQISISCVTCGMKYNTIFERG